MKKPVKAAVFAICLLGAACSSQIRNHGYVPPNEDLTQIVVGQDTRESVRALVGPPSADGVQRGGDYYYVQSKFRTLAFFQPEEVR